MAPLERRHGDGSAIPVTTEEAILQLRADPRHAPQMRDSYLDEDVAAAADRFARSGEFAAVKQILGPVLSTGAILDLGAGTGIAAHAFASAGARMVVAVEPDPSPVVGQGAIRTACSRDGAVRIVSGVGEALPFRDGAFDVVYARQVLHHARDLGRLLRDGARVLRPGGMLIACREHVVDDAEQLRAFLEAHPVHQLAGGEHAFPLQAYLDAISGPGMEIQSVLGPWSSVINAYPAVHSDEELADHARSHFLGRHGLLGHLALLVPGMRRVAERERDAPVPGRLYTFVCRK